MPAIEGVYTKHPDTGADGLWVRLCSPWGLVGDARSKWPAVPSGASNPTKVATWTAAFNSYFNQFLTATMAVAQAPAADEPGCTRNATTYTAQIVSISVTVASTNPITFSELRFDADASQSVLLNG